MRNLEEQVEFLLQQAVVAAQRDGLVPPQEIVARDGGQHAGAHPRLAVGVAGDAGGNGALAVVPRLSGLGFKAEAVGQGPAPRLFRLDQDRLVGGLA